MKIPDEIVEKALAAGSINSKGFTRIAMRAALAAVFPAEYARGVRDGLTEAHGILVDCGGGSTALLAIDARIAELGNGEG